LGGRPTGSPRLFHDAFQVGVVFFDGAFDHFVKERAQETENAGGLAGYEGADVGTGICAFYSTGEGDGKCASDRLAFDQVPGFVFYDFKVGFDATAEEGCYLYIGGANS
jgi:hypothetical protein